MNHVGGSYCFTIGEMARNIKNKRKLKLSNDNVEKREIIRMILLDFMKLVLDDVINNGIQFRFSTPTEAYILIEGVYGEEFKKHRRNGRFYEIDPILSNFTGHDIVISWKGSKRIHKRNIMVSYTLKDIITDKTNEGFKY